MRAKKSVDLHEATSRLSASVEDAAGGTTILIAMNGELRAMPMPSRSQRRRKPANALGVTYIADDFDR